MDNWSEFEYSIGDQNYKLLWKKDGSRQWSNHAPFNIKAGDKEPYIIDICMSHILLNKYFYTMSNELIESILETKIPINIILFRYSEVVSNITKSKFNPIYELVPIVNTNDMNKQTGLQFSEPNYMNLFLSICDGDISKINFNNKELLFRHISDGCVLCIHSMAHNVWYYYISN